MKVDAANEDTNDARELRASNAPLRREIDMVNLEELLAKLLNDREAEVDRLKTRLAALEKEATEQKALRAQADQALALTRRQMTAVLQERATKQEPKSSQIAEMQQLQTRLEAAERALAESQQQVAATESALRQRTEEASQAWNQLSAESEQVRALEQKLQDQLEAQANLHTKLAELEEWTFKLAGDRRAAEEKLRSTQRALEKQQKLRDSSLHEVRAMTGDLARLKKSLKAKAAAHAALEAQLDEAYGEIATITQLLKASEALTTRSRSQMDWLAQVSGVVLSNARGWRALLPMSVRQRMSFRTLAERRLFDAEAYLRRYPDVRASGDNPLRHYILHGMAEGRQF